MSEDNKRPGYKRKHRLVVDEVADHVGLRRDVVEKVLNGFYDVAAERILNERKFTIKGIVSIHAITTKNGIRKEPHLQYRARVSSLLKKILKKTEDDPSLIVDKSNWRNIAAKLQPAKDKTNVMNVSDFLKDDDEDF